MRDQRIAKLPIWAQNLIERLERDLADARAKLTAGPDDADTFADPYSDYLQDLEQASHRDRVGRPLGREIPVRYYFGPRWDEHLEANLVDGRLTVRTASGGRLLIEPVGSNGIIISVEPRR